MNSFQKLQAQKILSMYNDLEKGRKPLPLGTKSKDGKYIKTSKGWEVVEKESNIKVDIDKESINLPNWFNTKNQINSLIKNGIGGTFNTKNEADKALSKIEKDYPDQKGKVFIKDSKTSIIEEDLKTGKKENKIVSRFQLKYDKNGNGKVNKEEFSDIKSGNLKHEDAINKIVNYGFLTSKDKHRVFNLSNEIPKILSKYGLSIDSEDLKKIRNEVKPILEQRYSKNNMFL